MNYFQFNTYALIDDLNDVVHKKILTNEIIFQDNFLKSKVHFRSKDYKWPNDAIRNWSRVWEYPYVEFHIERYFNEKSRKLKIIDFGSGVTFFPFQIEKYAEKVFCLDNDKTCVDDLKKAVDFYKSDIVESIKVNSFTMPFEDQSVDIIYSVSVLEHINNRHILINEFKRILKDDGVLILTYDISFDSGHDIGKEDFKTLQDEIKKNFKPLYLERPVHAGDLLLSDRGPYPAISKSLIFKIVQFVKQSIIKPILGRKPYYFPLLAARGEVFLKK